MGKKRYREWREPSLPYPSPAYRRQTVSDHTGAEPSSSQLARPNVTGAYPKGIAKGRLEMVDGLPVRRVPKGTIKKMVENNRPLGVLQGGMSRRKAGKILGPDGKFHTVWVLVPVAGKTSAFEEYRLYKPEGEVPNFEDVDGIKKSMPSAIPEKYTQPDNWGEDATAEERQLMFDPKPRGGRGYTISG